MSSNESYHIDIESQEEIKIDGLSFNLQSDRYKIGKQLGRGAFGVVVSAFDRNSDCAVAIKQIPRVFDNLDILLYVTREILVLDILRHPNIVSLRELEFERENLFIVTEKCNANLDVFVRSKDYNRVKCKYIHQIIYQTLQAVDYMHSFNIMHRDIKPENILLDKDLNVKLCDFGLARLCTTIKKENRNLTEYVVTRWYRAPEVILVKSGYGTKQDIWSVGCMIGFMLLRGALFPGQSAVDQIVVIAYILGRLDEADLDFIHCDRTKSFMDKINENNENNLGLSQVFGRVSSVHAPVISLLHLLLNFNPFRRVSALEALSHPLFDQFRKSGEAVMHVPSSTSSTTSSSSTSSSYSSKIYPIAVEKAESLAGLARCNNMLSKHSEDELASEIIALRIRLQTQNYHKKNFVAVIPTAVLSSSQYDDDVASEVETAGASMTIADTTTRCRRQSLPRTNSKTNQLSRLSVDASTTTNDQITDPLNETMIIHINQTEMEQQLSTTATAVVPTKQNHNKPTTTKKVNSTATATASFQHRPLTYDINKHSSERVRYLSASPVEEEEDVDEEEGINGYNEEEEDVLLLPVLQVENENDINDNIQYSVSEKNKKTTTSRLVSMYRGMTLQASRSLPASPSEKISVAATTTAASANKVHSEGTANLPTNVTASTTISCSPTGHSDLMAGISFILPKTNKIPDLRFKAQNSRLQTITEQQQYLHHQQIQRHRIEVASKRRHQPVRVLTSQPTPTQQSQSQSQAQLLLPDTTMITTQAVEGTEVVHDTPSQPSCLVSGNSTGSVERLDSSSTITSHMTNTLPKLHHYSVTNEHGGNKEKDTTSTNVPRCSQYRPVSAILKEGKEEVQNGHHPSSFLNPYRSIKFTNGNGNFLPKGYGGHTVTGNGSLNHDVLDIGTTRSTTRTTRTSTTTTIREETRRLSV